MPQFTFTNRLMEKALRRAFLDGVMEIYESCNQPRVYSITLEGTLSLLINKTEKYYIKLQETAERAKQADPRLIPKLPNLLAAQKIVTSKEKTDFEPNDSVNYLLKNTLGGAENQRCVINIKSEPDDKDGSFSSLDMSPSNLLASISTTKTPIMTFPPKLLQRILPKPSTTTVTVVSPKMSSSDTSNSISYTMCNNDHVDYDESSPLKIKTESIESVSPVSSALNTVKVELSSHETTVVSTEGADDDDVMVVQPEWIEETAHSEPARVKRDRECDEDGTNSATNNGGDTLRKRIKASLKNPIMAINLPTGGTANYKDLLYFHKNIVECPLCKEPISNQTFLLLHLDRHRKDLVDECQTCAQGTQPIDMLLFHLTNFHTPDGAKETDIAKAKAPSLNLATTSSTNTRVDPSKMVQFMLERENTKVTEVKKEKSDDNESDTEFAIEYVCDICGESYKSSKDLAFHNKSEHSNNTGIYQCPTCQLNFDNIFRFQDHLHEHSKEDETCKCENCGRDFTKWKDLKHHLMTAHRKFYTCPHCKVSFSDQDSLKEHIVVHSDSKPDFYECDMCDKTFVSSKTYNAHRRSHIDVKPYVCLICQSAFFKRGDMAKHMRTIHEPTKLYMCKICGRTGTRADNMRVHVRTHKKEISREQVDQLLQKVDQ